MSAPHVIIGASGAIGSALSNRLIIAGEPVFLTARSLDKLTSFDHELVTGRAVVDVLNSETVASAIATADQGDGIQSLTYCVGSIVLKPLKASTDDDFLEAFHLNLLGVVRCLRAAGPSLKKAKGSVVLFSSIAVQQGFTNHSVISAAKGAIEGLTLSMAAEWAPDIRVNAIAPSLTDTPLARQLTGSAPMRDAIEKMHPIPRLGQPDDSASLAQYLVGRHSGWITGQIFHVDGGRSTLRTKG